MPHEHGQLDPDALRAFGHRAVDWAAAYWETLRREPERFAVASKNAPGDVLRALPEEPPFASEFAGMKPEQAWELIARDLDTIITPGLTHWQHPHFFAFFPANTSAPSVVGEILAAGLGVQGMLWATSPACTELEQRVLDWLGGALGLPEAFLFRGGTGGGGVIQGTASEAVLVAVVAARDRARRAMKASERAGERPHWTLYASSQAHSSVVKAAMVAGLAEDADDRTHVRLVGTDAHYRMDPAALARALAEDRASGRTPIFVCASVGTTGSTAIDNVAQIARVVRERTAGTAVAPWLHIDAAHAGAACICPEFRDWIAGVEHADSFCMNPHKWLLTNFDCDCFWTRDSAAVVNALSITPEYLRNRASDEGSVVDYRDWHVPLGRRLRALKLWLVMRYYGVDGLRGYIRGHIALAEWFEGSVRTDSRFEVATLRTMNLVCFRLAPLAGETPTRTDARNRALLDAMNTSGKVFLTHTVLPAVPPGVPHARFVLRMAIGAASTTRVHVEWAWELARELAGIGTAAGS